MKKGLNMPDYNNRNIVLHELIGLDVVVTRSADPSRYGIKGRVINETKNTLVIRTVGGVKTVPKLSSTFKFLFGKKRFIVCGEEINFRPHERLEKSLRFYRRRRA